MNGNIEKLTSQQSLSSKLGEAHDLLIKITKIASIVGAICGFIYLLSYTTHVGIPFPLELSVLPTTLLIVGLTSFVATFIIIAGMFIPALTLDYNDEVTKGFRKADDQTDIVKVRFTRYFFCTWAPTALALSGVICLLGVVGDAQGLKLLGGITIFVAMSWIFYTPKYLEVFFENRWQYFLVNSLQILLSVFAYSLIVIILIAVYPDINNWSAWSSCLLALLIFTLFHLIIFIPATNSAKSETDPPTDSNGETMPPMTLAFALAAVWTTMTVTMPQVNYKIGGAVLRAFHVGGNVPVAICLKSKPAAAITQRLMFDGEHCSEKLSMKLDSGDRVYVSKFIPIKDSQPPNENLQPDIVYFRQDEIKQKIYFGHKKDEPH